MLRRRSRAHPRWRGWVSVWLAVTTVCTVVGWRVADASSSPAGARGTTVAPTDWPAYLDGPLHASYAASETTITPANVPSVSRQWQFDQGQGYLSSPIVVDGSVYIGANNGWFYMLDAATGQVVHKAFLGAVRITSCPPPPTGMVSTATVAVDPATGQPTVYASGANGYLYAMSASNLALRWRAVIAIPSATVNNYFDWSSPTVANGRIYVGVSSNCDSPLVRGGIVSFNQLSGRRLSEFYTVPRGRVGASIWSSAAVAPDGDVFATTGNGPLGSGPEQLLGDSESIIKLSPTLRYLGRYQIPASEEGFDTDFGASPLVFGPYVGACNKNGDFYALNAATMRLSWRRQVSGPAGGNEECIATPAWNGQHLFFGTPGVTIGNTTYAGSVQERDPDGSLVWSTGLPNAIDGSPTLDGAGVLAVGTYDVNPTPNATYLIDAANGRIVRQLVTGGDFAQSVFAEGWLFTANQDGVAAWGTAALQAPGFSTRGGSDAHRAAPDGSR